jgi:hypothetical protein
MRVRAFWQSESLDRLSHLIQEHLHVIPRVVEVGKVATVLNNEVPVYNSFNLDDKDLIER